MDEDHLRRRSLNRCYLCGPAGAREVHDRCRDTDKIRVLRCESCGLVYLSDASHISDVFYEDSGMFEFEKPDRAKILREEAMDTERRVRFLSPLVRGKRYLDFGCGAAGVPENLKSLCSASEVVELNQPLRELIGKELGIPAFRTVEETGGRFDLISLFHVLEHLPDPISELGKLREKLAPGGRIVIEVPHAEDALISLYGCEAFKDFTYWSCHLFLFTEATLREVLKRAGFARVNVEFVQRYSLANHLHWLAKGKPGGHQAWAQLDSPALNEAYARKLAERKITDTLVASAWLS
jgi:SAM-dependent methyltransferase